MFPKFFATCLDIGKQSTKHMTHNMIKKEWVSIQLCIETLSFEENCMSRPPCSKPVDLLVIDLCNIWMCSPDSMLNQRAKSDFNKKLL